MIDGAPPVPGEPSEPDPDDALDDDALDDDALDDGLDPGSDAPAPARGLTRRRLLTAGGGVAAAAVVVAGVTATVGLPRSIRARLNDPGGTIPDMPVGEVRLETVRSEARGRDVGLFTAVPAGQGNGAGLPVCLVLHGASATTADFAAFGLPQFLTAAVRAGAPPFVLVGVDGGRIRWEPTAGDDPQRMLVEEVPVWCEQRGFDPTRMAAHGWSMGGYGSLLLAASHPGLLRAVAVLSPAVGGGLLAPIVDQLEGDRVAVWCGKDDALYGPVQDFVASVPGGTAIAAYADGAHTRSYWNTVTVDALTFAGSRLG